MGCKIPEGDFFFLSRSFFFFFFLLYGPQVDPFFFSIFLFVCRMERGHKGVSTSQARHKRGIPWETPTTSSLVDVMSAEELRLYSQIPVKISLETLDSGATSTIREAGNVIYFTRE